VIALNMGELIQAGGGPWALGPALNAVRATVDTLRNEYQRDREHMQTIENERDSRKRRREREEEESAWQNNASTSGSTNTAELREAQIMSQNQGFANFGRTWKAITGSYGQRSISELGTFDLLNGIGGGTNNDQRVGTNIVMKHVLAKGMIKLNFANTTVDYNPRVSLFLICDRQANGSLPAVNQIFDTSFGGDKDYLPMNLAFRDRFIKLWEWRHSGRRRTTDESTQGYYVPFTLKKYIDTKAVYLNSNSVISAITTCSLLLVALSNCQGAAVDKPLLYYWYRVRYLDK
jgi:hypothetical protein